MTIDKMRRQDRLAAFELETNQFSEVTLVDRRRNGGGFVAKLFALCDRRGGLRDDEAREAASKVIRNRLFNTRLGELGRRHIEKLRSQATISKSGNSGAQPGVFDPRSDSIE